MCRATHYSVAIVAYGHTRKVAALVAGILLALQASLSPARADGADTNSPAPHLQQIFEAAQQAYGLKPKEEGVAWRFARACFDRAEFPSNSTHRAELAKLGIEAALTALAQDSNSAPAHYYLGMNYGQLARTKTLGALPLVDKMEVEFQRAAQLDESFDYAGPHRNLGRLYFEAPAFASVGDYDKAKKHFNRASKLAPDYPENRLNQIEASIRWRKIGDARRELELLEDMLEAAHAKFNGMDWATAWMDWDARLEKVRAALRKSKSPTGAAKGAALLN